MLKRSLVLRSDRETKCQSKKSRSMSARERSVTDWERRSTSGRPLSCRSRIRISRSKEASSDSVTVAGSLNPYSSSRPLISFSARNAPTITTGTFTTRRTGAVSSQRRGRGIAEIENRTDPAAYWVRDTSFCVSDHRGYDLSVSNLGDIFPLRFKREFYFWIGIALIGLGLFFISLAFR